MHGRDQSTLTPLARCRIETKPEFRKGERFRHEYIIKLGQDLTLSPNYAVALNLSETGMYFKSLFEMVPGARTWVVINDSISGQNQVPARVVWCRKLENSNAFRYSVGVEFLQAQTVPALRASLPAAPQTETPARRAGGVVIQMSKRSPE
jgi:hypothetical protein